MRNMIKGVEVNGQWCKDKKVVKSTVEEFFKARFTRESEPLVRLDNVQFNTISDEDNELLVGVVSEEEVNNVVWSCDSSKSPGPDGFNFSFIKFCWDCLKEDIVLAINDFMVNGRWHRGTNASFICLIPKNDNPQCLSEYRSISLVGCVYKIVSKILSIKLKKVISKVIDIRQSAFLEGRGILDSILIANEVIEETKRKKKSCVCFTVDYEKAYDCVRWDFIYYMLDKLNFCEKWISWIKVCLELASISVLVNGSPTKEFIPKKGLRQDDPLSPFLFLIVVEGLAGVSRTVVKKEFVEGLEIGKKAVKVNMLQYADDTLFSCKANIKSVFNIKIMLSCFKLVSGLKVKFLKSRIGGVGVEQTEILSFVFVLNCEIMRTPFKYLGLPVGGCNKRGRFWDEVVNKIKRRLGKWKGRFISMAGRICLIKSVLSSISLLYLSLFKIPSNVLKKIVSLQRNFLWGWRSEGRKIAWLAWDKICNSKEAGGLGIINVRSFNLALLGKWIWR